MAGKKRTPRATTTTVREPDFAQACQWWDDLPDVWTPIGWKSHLFRFNVFYNGCLMALPNSNRRSETWEGQGVQVAIAGPAHGFGDDDQVHQGWNDSAAPVLWSNWVSNGLLLTQEVFAHIPGGGDVRTGIEPLFAWVRLTISDLCPGLPLDPTYRFEIRINAPHVGATMRIRCSSKLNLEKAAYPRTLTGKAASSDPGAAFLLGEGGNIRLGVAPAATAGKRTIVFTPRPPERHDDLMTVELPVEKGASFELLVPMIPCTKEVFGDELALGYDGALAQANAYWSQQPATAARVVTPEPFINDAIQHSLRFAEVIAEKNPADSEYSLLSGSWVYASLWTTPFAMNAIMLMDAMGYHQETRKYLEVFRRQQGTVIPPGDCFTRHPGYLSSPAALRSIDWLSDHGAVLYTLAAHALLSGDQQFIGDFTPCIVEACRFIQYARRIRGHGGVEGVMPPAIATDMMTKIQGVWNDGWNYKGLTTAVRLLQQIGHETAEEFATEAQEYRRHYVEVYTQACAAAPTWNDRRGKSHPLTPNFLFAQKEVDTAKEIRHAFYLDTGPLFLVFSGLFPASHPLMKSTLAWFREGPQTRWYRAPHGNGNCWQLPCLRHEISSCEPCYSWNVFHSWQSGDRSRFLEGMYSLFAGSLSRETYISCETRGGITGTLFSAPLANYLARLAVIDDDLAANQLHLLRLMPLAWLAPGKTARFERMPTIYGPVTLTATLAGNGQSLDVTFAPQWRSAPGQVILHVPPLPGLKTVRVNKAVVKPKAGKVRLPVAAPAAG